MRFTIITLSIIIGIMIIIIMIGVAQVKLVCPMEGNPAPIIEWSKGDQMVRSSYKISLKIKEENI